jgi:ATP-dependent exoDNAse (exonuclease V) beta subunit
VDVGREQPFAFVADETGGGPLINGYLDVVAREPDGTLLVVDYKTDAVGDADLERLTERDYGAQRLAYALAGLAAGARTVEVAHCYLERSEELASASTSSQAASSRAASTSPTSRTASSAQAARAARASARGSSR